LRVARRWCRVSIGLVGPVQRTVARVDFLAFADVAHREHACASERGELDEPRAGVAAVVDVPREDIRVLSRVDVAREPEPAIRYVKSVSIAVPTSVSSAPAASGIRSESLTINLLEPGAGGTRLLPVARTCFAELGVSMYARHEIEQLRSDIHRCIEHADEMGNL
jgi:hypothetical protein